MQPTPAHRPGQSSTPSTILGGLLVRKECWTLSRTAKLLLLTGLIAFVIAGMRTIHPFLSVTNRIDSKWLVVEGWIPTRTLKQAAAEFKLGHYEHILVVKGVYDVEDKYESGRYTGDYVANLLVEYGVPRDAVDVLFCDVARKDRTYHSALSARQWLTRTGQPIDAIDLATSGPHARRSRLLYEKAFGASTKIGIIALDDRVYDPAIWWQSSEGVREVLGECIAYGYARILFYPSHE